MRGPEVIERAHITYRQLDYWLRTDAIGLPDPDRFQKGSGFPREFTPSDCLSICLYAELIRAGITHILARRILDSGEYLAGSVRLSEHVTLTLETPLEEALADIYAQALAAA